MRPKAPITIVETVVKVNDERKVQMAERIVAAAHGSVQGKRIGMLGLTFKPNTDDMRDSASLDIIPALQKLGASVRAFDPEGMHEAEKLLSDVAYAKDAYDAIQGADVLVILTEWNEFRSLDWERVRQQMPGRIVVDLRNIYDPALVSREGFAYHSIGRAPALPA